MTEQATEVLVSGPVTLDTAKQEVTVQDLAIHFEPKEYDLLKALMLAKGEVVDHAELFQVGWGGPELASKDQLHTYIMKIRMKVGEDFIKNLPRIGYRWSKPVTIRAAGTTLEHTGRLEGYRSLARRYPGHPLLRLDEHSCPSPISLLCEATPGRRMSLLLTLGKVQYQPRPDVEQLADALLTEGRQKGEVNADELKVGLSDWTLSQGVSEDVLCLAARPVRYSFYLATNRLVARDGNARERLVPNDLSLMISPQAVCSNHIGISCLVVTCDGHLIFPQASQTIASSAGDVVPSVSGSADWPLEKGVPKLTEPLGVDFNCEIRREFIEELVPHHHVSDHYGEQEIIDELGNSLLPHVEPLGMGVNLERGGKPEVFFLGFSSHDLRYFRDDKNRSRTSKEHALKIADHLPSPFLGITEMSKPDPARVRANMPGLVALASQPQLNSILRASLILLIRLARSHM